MTTLACASYRDTDYPEPCFIENPLSLPATLLNEIVADPFLANASSIQDKLSTLGYAGTIVSDCVDSDSFNGKHYLIYEFSIRP